MRGKGEERGRRRGGEGRRGKWVKGGGQGVRGGDEKVWK